MLPLVVLLNNFSVKSLCRKFSLQCSLCFFLDQVTNKGDLQQIVGGSEHTLRAKLTFSQESHGMISTLKKSLKLLISMVVFMWIFD